MKLHPFSQEELNIRYRYPAGSADVLGKPEFSTPVGVKENMRRFASGEVPVWMPYGQYQVFGPEILPDNVARGRVFEENATSRKGGVDLFGVNWVYDYSARGSMVRPGNPMLADVNDWKAVIPFPDVDAWDWEGSAKRNARFLQTDLPIQMTQFSGLFERLISFMDFENAALALIDEEQEAAMDDLFSALTDVYIQIVDKCVEHFGLDWYQLFGFRFVLLRTDFRNSCGSGGADRCGAAEAALDAQCPASGGGDLFPGWRRYYAAGCGLSGPGGSSDVSAV